MARVSESLGYVTLFEPVDKTGSALVSDAVDMARFNSFTAFLFFGAITADSVLTVYSDATSALATSLTTAIAFKYRLSGADFKVALADQFGDPVSVASTGLTLTAATFDHRCIAIEIDPDTLGSSGHWVTFNLSSVGNPLLVAGIGIGRGRYTGHTNPSAI